METQLKMQSRCFEMNSAATIPTIIDNFFKPAHRFDARKVIRTKSTTCRAARRSRFIVRNKKLQVVLNRLLFSQLTISVTINNAASSSPVKVICVVLIESTNTIGSVFEVTVGCCRALAKIKLHITKEKRCPTMS